jgi:hypothetical protein
MMSYKNKFVVAIKSSGKVLRENAESVQLPFGSEYSIFLRNLDARRASVKISIDNIDVLGGDELVVNGNSSMDLERFFSGNLSEGRKFKFIERTGEIEDHRGVKAEDGIIRVEFRYEVCQAQPYFQTDWYSTLIGSYQDSTPSRSLHRSKSSNQSFLNAVGTAQCNASTAVYGSAGLNAEREVLCSASLASCAAVPVNDVGITVEGSRSNQSFYEVKLGMMESQSNVIVLQLKGVSKDSIPVAKPITVKTKKFCTSCGNKFESSFEYCPKDGTYLKA